MDIPEILTVFAEAEEIVIPFEAEMDAWFGTPAWYTEQKYGK